MRISYLKGGDIMEKNIINIDFALLSWVRLNHNIFKSAKDKKQLEEELLKLADYLESQHIKDLEVIYKSKDFNTLRYLREGQTCIKQFTTKEVELFL